MFIYPLCFLVYVWLTFFGGFIDLDLDLASLQGNQISSVPVSIGRLSNLKALSLANNRLAALPDAIGSCASLRLLDVSGNKDIAVLPR